jgi:hypothetical protein
LKKYCVIAASAPALTLAAKACRSASGELRLRVRLGVGRHLDVEVVAGLGADEGHQVAGVAELAHAP